MSSTTTYYTLELLSTPSFGYCRLHAKLYERHATLYVSNVSSPITRRHILDWSKLKKSADNNFRFDENSRKFSEQVENTVGKG